MQALPPTHPEFQVGPPPAGQQLAVYERKLSESASFNVSQMRESMNAGKKKFSLMQSVRSIFSKSKRDAQKQIELEQALIKKTLKPCGQTVKQCSEVTNLQQLIEKSREFVIGREDYFMLENVEPVNSIDELSSSVKNLTPQFNNLSGSNRFTTPRKLG